MCKVQKGLLKKIVILTELFLEVIRAVQKKWRKNKAIFTFNIYGTKSNSMINVPQVQTFLLELLPVV